MKVFQEITEWAVPTPNHTYFCDDSKSKIYGYIPVGTKDVRTFKKPIRFDIRKRRFVEVPNAWNFEAQDQPQGRTWKVQGSRGDVHTVSETNGNLACSCAGFKFRGQCKHLDLAK